MRTRQAVASLPSRQTPDASRILDMGTAFWASKTLLSAVELGVFTQLGPGPLPFEPLRERLGLHPRAARDFLDALVALGFLDRDGSVYRNTRDAAAFLDKAKPSYIGGLLEMLNERLYGFWGRLTEALRTGEPQNESRAGRDPFEDIYATPERMRGFLSAMTGVSLPAAQAIAAEFPWARHCTLFDIGAAQGCVPVQVASAHHHITGGGMDLPKVGPVFEEYVSEHGLSDRLRFVAGDMFHDDWPHADVYVMGHILHDWGLDRKRQLVSRAYQALPPGGALIVYDAMIDDDRRENAFGLLMSLNMLIETSEGFDYTSAECRHWLQQGGFSDVRAEPLPGPDTMVWGVK
jgi:O-methyltransferase domain/Dimerisation domain